MVNLREFYKNKRVLITGHTGFKGSWLTFWLHEMDAEVCGYALEAPKDSLYDLIDGDGLCVSRIGDIADFEHLKEVFDAFSPDRLSFGGSADRAGRLSRSADDLSHQRNGDCQSFGVYQIERKSAVFSQCDDG